MFKKYEKGAEECIEDIDYQKASQYQKKIFLKYKRELRLRLIDRVCHIFFTHIIFNYQTC